MSRKNKNKNKHKKGFWAWVARFIKSCFLVSFRMVLFTVMLLLLLVAGLWLVFLKTFNAQHISELLPKNCKSVWTARLLFLPWI